MDKLRVIVVDDSALMRKLVSEMINEETDMEVIDTARNGEELLIKLAKNVPDLITLDVEMPKMDGVTTLKEMKKRNMNIPVIVLSSMSNKGVHITMECLAAGAFDFLAKPSGPISLDINNIKLELIQKIRAAFTKLQYTMKKNIVKETVTPTYERNNNRDMNKINDIKRENNVQFNNKKSNKIDAVVIGASTGGPRALYTVITNLPKDLGVPVFVVQHMPAGFTKAFAERLNNNSKMEVLEAQDKMYIQKNVVYVAPGGFHMEVKEDNRIHLNTEPAIWGVRPAVDKLFISASKVYKSNILSVVLTGMGRDGAQGTVEIKENGGITASEDKSTCTIYGMPRAAYETGKVDMVLPIQEVAYQIVRVVSGYRG